MVVAELESALAPYAPYIVLAFIGLLLYAEARGAWHRWGTTARRSNAGKGIVLGVTLIAAIWLLLEGWALYAGLLLVAVLLLGLWLPLEAVSSSRRPGA